MRDGAGVREAPVDVMPRIAQPTVMRTDAAEPAQRPAIRFWGPGIVRGMPRRKWFGDPPTEHRACSRGTDRGKDGGRVPVSGRVGRSRPVTRDANTCGPAYARTTSNHRRMPESTPQS